MKDSLNTKVPQQITTGHENDHSAEQNSNAEEESNPAEPEPGQHEARWNDMHELPAANQNENILISENKNSISTSNAVPECSFKIQEPKLPKFAGKEAT